MGGVGWVLFDIKAFFLHLFVFFIFSSFLLVFFFFLTKSNPDERWKCHKSYKST